MIRAFRALRLRNQHVLVLSDNACVVGSARRCGSKSPTVNKEVLSFLKLAEETECTFEFMHVAGRENIVADALSRDTLQEGEWSLPMEEFLRLQSLHGHRLLVDLFATPLNNKVEAFFCPFEFPRAEGKDAYLQDLNRFSQIYAFPPPDQAVQLLEFLQSYRGDGLLVLPNRSSLVCLLPERPLVFPLPLGVPPSQVVQGVTHPHPDGSGAFLAWSFSARPCPSSLALR